MLRLANDQLTSIWLPETCCSLPSSFLWKLFFPNKCTESHKTFFSHHCILYWASSRKEQCGYSCVRTNRWPDVHKQKPQQLRKAEDEHTNTFTDRNTRSAQWNTNTCCISACICVETACGVSLLLVAVQSPLSSVILPSVKVKGHVSRFKAKNTLNQFFILLEYWYKRVTCDPAFVSVCKKASSTGVYS